jgi:DNA repair exonuclease SbcCD ATPase subunit
VTRGEQVTAQRAAFVMEQFRVVAPGRLEVEGRWEGVHGVDLDRAVLVLEAKGRVDRVEADAVRRTPNTWHAVFAWNGEPAAIDRAQLEVGDRLLVEIRARPSARRRLGRAESPVLRLDPRARATAEDDGPDADIVSLHAALAASEDQLAVAKEETEIAREAARRAREDAEREHGRRESEATRLHAALDKLKQVADNALRAERARVAEQAGEIERIEHELTGVRAESESLRNELAQRQQEHEQIEARNRQLGVLLSDARQDSERLAQVEAERDGALAEVQRLQAELDEAWQATVRSAVELEQATEQARQAAQLRDRLAAIRAALDDGR